MSWSNIVKNVGNFANKTKNLLIAFLWGTDGGKYITTDQGKRIILRDLRWQGRGRGSTGPWSNKSKN